MTAPVSLADIGVRVPGADLPAPSTDASRHHRFADVKAYVHGAMPTVTVGQIYEDLDPRSTGRTVRVLAVRRDGKALVKTLTARTCAPRTPSTQRRDTVGATSWIAQRRFRPNSRGFRLIEDPATHPLTAAVIAAETNTEPTPPTGTGIGAETDGLSFNAQVHVIALPLAKATGGDLTEYETRTAAALVGLLGFDGARQYLGLTYQPTGGAVADMFADLGPAELIADALLYADEEGWTHQWAQTKVATRAYVEKKMR